MPIGLIDNWRPEIFQRYSSRLSSLRFGNSRASTSPMSPHTDRYPIFRCCRFLERLVARQLLVYLSSAADFAVRVSTRPFDRDRCSPFAVRLAGTSRPWWYRCSCSVGSHGSFDTVGHDILLQRLQTSFRIEGVALQWFRSYIRGLFAVVNCSSHFVVCHNGRYSAHFGSSCM